MFNTTNPFQQMNTMDPLTTQFMSQGQMGYMPQAQYLTSADYGAYRTMPGMASGLNQTQSLSMWQAYVQANRGGVFGLNPYTIGTYNPMVNQTSNIINARRQLSDQQGILAGTGMGLGFSAMGGAIGFGMGGPLGALAGSALGSLVDPGSLLADRNRSMRTIQQMSMPSMVAGEDMAQSLGKGFTASAAGRLNEFIKKESVSDFAFNEKDYLSFLGKGVQHGLMDYSSSETQYGESLKKIRGNVKTLAAFLDNKDVAAIFKDMERIQTMGANMKDAGKVGVMESLFARTVGVSHQDMVDTYGQQGAMQYTQRGMTGIHGSLQAMANAASVTLSQRLGLTDAGELSRGGGKSGLIQRLTDGSANADMQFKKYFLPGLMGEGAELDPAKMEALRRGDFTTIMNNTPQRYSTPEKALETERKSDKIMAEVQKQLGPIGMQLMQAQRAIYMGSLIAPNASQVDQARAGLIHQGYDPIAATRRANQITSHEYLDGLRNQLSAQDRQIRMEIMSEADDAASPLNRGLHVVRAFGNAVGSNTIGVMAAAYNKRKDSKEQEALGIFQADSYGVDTNAQALGLAFTDEELAFFEDEAELVPTRQKIERDRALPRARKTLSTHRRMQGLGRDQVDEAQALKNLGMDTGDVTAMARRMSPKDLSKDSMALKMVAASKMQGNPITKEDAMARLGADGDAGYNFALLRTKEEMPDLNIKWLQSESVKAKKAVAGDMKARAEEANRQAKKAIHEVTGKSWWGGSGAGDLQDIMKNSKASAAEVMGVYKIQALMESELEQDRLTGKSALSPEAVEKIREEAMAQDMDPAEVDQMLAGHDLSILAKHAEGRGVSKEEFDRSGKLARKAGRGFGGSGVGEFVENIDYALNTTRKAQYRSGELNTVQTLTAGISQFGYEGSIEDLLSDPKASEQQLSKKDIDPKYKKMLELIQSMQAERKGGAHDPTKVTLQQLTLRALNTGALDASFTDDTLSGVQTSKNDQKGELLKNSTEQIKYIDTFKSQISDTDQLLNKTLDTVDKTLKELTTELKKAGHKGTNLFGAIFRVPGQY